MTLTSHTLVKHGMPFIGTVLRTALPHVDKMLITISVNADEETIREIFSLRNPKIEIFWEDVKKFGDLTKERQRMVDKTTSDWIWFLDDDDLYPEETIKEIKSHFNEDIDGISLTPYQLLGNGTYDYFWLRKKSFTKFFRNGDIHYENPFPRDTIYKGSTPLYWKHNLRVKRIDKHFFHLGALKDGSFRKEKKYARHQYNSPTIYTIDAEAASWLRLQGTPRVF